ncbi:ABC transporter substrate-binding protein [Alkalicoccobacillus plakortidis]|uniref:ABC transporter substrate-binding protein n=1 Tax=Alkalicoccobacillus plakortidis TaxID=444060 RepID=A0ABT0XNR2_9BACI|nr:ABC transporter substrate-binding protein [Alkalicoccobacillus plakortidis]MCM2677355.1 ABC transporter substrate-binding protein [Alkalicoccobacillus plakortidis]
MKKALLHTSVLACVLMLAACGSQAEETEGTEQEGSASESESSGEQVVTYLGEDYTIPENVERIVVTGAMEAMEDSLVLDVEPIGVMTVGGSVPDMFAPITSNAEPIGEKTEPDVEKILSLDPDVILASTKFPPEVVEELEKVAPTIKISHIASDWEESLEFLGQLTGKEDLATESIASYYSELDEAKESIGDQLDDKTVLAVRVRNNDLYIYPSSIFVNSILYDDLDIAAPVVTEAAQAQELISIEQLAEINPDYLFIQDAAAENSGAETEIIDQLKQDPILDNVPALTEDQTYVNIIDPLSEGGPSWSRMAFLNEVTSLFEN